MALTQDQWFQKLKKFVPSWWFEKYVFAPALFMAIGNVMQQIQQDGDDQFDAVFLGNETTPILDLSGAEVGKTRLAGESDANYVTRIRTISNQSDEPDIKALVDSLLLIPGCKIQQQPLTGMFLNRGICCSRDNYLTGFLFNFFIIIVPKQIAAPNSFSDGQNTFCNRLNFIGTDTDPTQQFATIIQQVNNSIAFGVMYSIVESNEFVVV